MAVDGSGYVYVGLGVGPTGSLLSDMWRSAYTFNHIPAVVGACGMLLQPNRPIGLSCWPGSTQCAVQFTAVTTAAPWGARLENGITFLNTSITYTSSSGTSVTIPAGTNTMVVWAGSAYSNSAPYNDVWASTDQAVTWSRISVGNVSTQIGATVCADSLGNLFILSGDALGFGSNVNVMWRSSNGGVTWSNTTNNAWKPRRNAVCVVDSNNYLYFLGGKAYNDSTQLPAAEVTDNSVWMSTNSGNSWQQQTAQAPWLARDGPSAASYYSSVLGKTVLYVSTGYVYPAVVQNVGVVYNTSDEIAEDNGNAVNDVWASSDMGVSWSLVTSNPGFPCRSHGRMRATQNGVLLISDGSSETGSYGDEGYLADLWASLDGGFTSDTANTTKLALLSTRMHSASPTPSVTDCSRLVVCSYRCLLVGACAHSLLRSIGVRTRA